MNIFILDESPILSAKAQHDRHVVKMILESAQMLSAACNELPTFGERVESHHRELLYKTTHANHPATKWAGQYESNFVWLTAHAVSLHAEYARRFMKVHGCYPLIVAMTRVACKIVGVDSFWTKNASREHVVRDEIMAFAAKHSPFVYCGPDQYATRGLSSNQAVVASYRQYYLAEKCASNRWTNPVYKPAWLEHKMTIHIKPLHAPKPAAKPHVPAGMAIPSWLKRSV